MKPAEMENLEQEYVNCAKQFLFTVVKNEFPGSRINIQYGLLGIEQGVKDAPKLRGFNVLTLSILAIMTERFHSTGLSTSSRSDSRIFG